MSLKLQYKTCWDVRILEFKQMIIKLIENKNFTSNANI